MLLKLCEFLACYRYFLIKTVKIGTHNNFSYQFLNILLTDSTNNLPFLVQTGCDHISTSLSFDYINYSYPVQALGFHGNDCFRYRVVTVIQK